MQEESFYQEEEVQEKFYKRLKKCQTPRRVTRSQTRSQVSNQTPSDLKIPNMNSETTTGQKSNYYQMDEEKK